MADPETLTLPTGETVTPEDVFLYNDYPYRFVPLDHEEYEFKLAPLYWGQSDMDVPFPDREALVEQWGADSQGTMTDAEWAAWVADRRGTEMFGEDELDAITEEVGLSEEVSGDDGIVASIRRTLGI
jgi:hypothetical protein